MKKLLSLLAAVSLMFSMNVFAVPASDIGTDVPSQVEVSIPTNIQLKENGKTDWSEGPISLFVPANNASFDFTATVDMQPVRDAFETLYANALAKAVESGIGEAFAETILKAMTVSGTFDVVITYPATGVDLPAAIIASDKLMTGFSGNGIATYEEVSRSVDTNSNDSTKKDLTIKIKVADTITVGAIKDDADVLSDLTLTAEAVKVTSANEADFEISGTVEGNTSATFNDGTKNVTVTVTYDSVQAAGGQDPENTTGISATVKVVKPHVSTGGGGGSSSSSKTITVKFDSNIEGVTVNNIGSKNKVEINVDTLNLPTVEGKEVEGIYEDAEFTKPITGKKVFDKDVTLYIKWIDAKPVEPGTEPGTDIFTDDHIAYVIGYPEGTVRPESNITREEATTIFYRLLRADKQIEIAATENAFNDVDADRWSNKAISSMAKGGFINGYANNEFRPENSITRAEFVTIIFNMYKLEKGARAAFVDVAEDHWANGYIAAVSSKGWINGYEGSYFKPDQAITRAEAMAIVNRMLGRKVAADGISADAKVWADIDASDWYYLDVIEATNAHEYTKAEGAEAETWTKVIENNVLAEKAEFEDAE